MINGIWVIAFLSLLDAALTYELAIYWTKSNKKIKLEGIEANKLIIYFWRRYGLLCGSIVSSIVLLTTQLLIGSIHTILYYLIVSILLYANFNHFRNIYIIKKGRL